MQFLLITLAYFATARLGAALSIPPDFASSVWPAAGVALCAFLLAPTRIAMPAVLLGAIAANLYRTTGTFVDVSLLSVMTAVTIAVGSTAQAWFGAWLYRHYLGSSSRWDDPKLILRFFLIVVLLGCVVGATIGTSILLMRDYIPLSRLWFNWITWWAGDSIGVLLVTPMIQVMLAPLSSFSRSRKLKTFVPLALILIVIYGLFAKSVEYNQERMVDHLKSEADHFSRTIESRLVIAENKLTAYTALFLASNFVTQVEFNRFSERVMEEDDAFQGVGWTQVLNHDGRLKWEAYFRKNGYPEFEFKEQTSKGDIITAPERDEYYPVLYIHPLEDNRKAFGLNLAANSERKDALLLAEKNRARIATAPITLAQEEEQEKAIIVYSPVFSRDATPDLIGYASGVLRVSGILGNSADRATQAGLTFNLFDISGAEDVSLFEQRDNGYSHELVLSYIENFAGRQYRLDVSPGEDYQFVGDGWTSYVILTCGFIIAALFQLFALTTSGTIESVTRQVEAQTRELKHAVSKANAASEAKSAFLANMSHELRTPLNAIGGFIHLTLETDLTAKQRDFLQKSSLASETLLGLINQTLDYAKIESGNMELEVGDVNVRMVARKMEAMFSHIADEKHLEFRIEVDREVPALLLGDHLRIEQIVMNLLSNAFKFTAQGIIGLFFDYDEGRLKIRVSDTGTGIPPEKREHIFLAFGQADASTSRCYGGTGLGLSISRRIANLMKGDITVKSQVGEGSEFHVYLMLEPSLETQASSIEELKDIKDISINGLHVLIVEDVVLNQILMQELLKSHGLTSTVAENGLLAINEIKNDPSIDMVLMDVQMPVMDGYEATRQIRLLNPSIPIIGMTANAMESDVKACLDVGMNAHMAKPVDPDALMATFRRFHPSLN